MIHTFIALRYIKGRKKFFWKGSNLLSMFGIFIGVFSLLVIASVMNGFDHDMQTRIIGAKSEIRVYHQDYQPFDDYNNTLLTIDKIKGISAAGPVCEAELLLQNKNHVASSVCYGIDFERQKKVNSVLGKIVVGSPDMDMLEDDGIIIGLDLSLTLNVTVGEYLQVSSPIGTEPTPFGLLPRSKKLKVIGLFISGLPEFDKVYTYVSLSNAQYLLGLGDVIHQLEIKTYNRDKAKVIRQEVEETLGDKFKVEDWSQFDANLFNAIRMEKAVMYLVLILLLLIASFNMAGNFIKLVIEKRSEIGILKALGSTEQDVKKIFIRLGIILGIMGTFLGEVLALIVLIIQQEYKLIAIPVAGFPIHWLPVEIRVIDFIIVPVIAVIISYLTTLRPAIKTVKIDPIRIIRE